jgi:hypothetical protein
METSKNYPLKGNPFDERPGWEAGRELALAKPGMGQGG